MSRKEVKNRKEYMKEYYELHEEKIKEHRKEYNKLNKEKLKEHAKEYYIINKDRINKNSFFCRQPPMVNC